MATFDSINLYATTGGSSVSGITYSFTLMGNCLSIVATKDKKDIDNLSSTDTQYRVC